VAPLVHAPAALSSPHVWTRPPFLRCQRDQACLPDSAGAAIAPFSAKLERGADRLPARRPLQPQGHAAQPRHAALGPDPFLGQGHQGRLLQHQCQGRGDREQAGIPQSVRAPALPGAGRQFYEWRKTATGKQPYALALADRSIMALAGLWENWHSPAGGWVRSFAIITTVPNQLCAEIHNCMPVILKPDAWPVWLGEEPADEPQLKALLAPYPADDMICWPVSARVGNVRNNDSSLIEPVAAA
jgi:hypothetical protein